VEDCVLVFRMRPDVFVVEVLGADVGVVATPPRPLELVLLADPELESSVLVGNKPSVVDGNESSVADGNESSVVVGNESSLNDESNPESLVGKDELSLVSVGNWFTVIVPPPSPEHVSPIGQQAFGMQTSPAAQ